jgi:hypothetical protein
MRFFRWLVWGRGHGVDELARRLDMQPRELRKFRPTYTEFTIPKRSGGSRRILAPADDLKKLQRRILRRLFGRLRAHPAAHGFERGRSIVTNALAHRGRDAVVRFDLVDFFRSTQVKRVKRYFRRIGWNRPAAAVLVRLCTHKGGLPQGAPTSPRLSNLVNYRLDARLAGLAAMLGGVYTRYADDLTISLVEDVENVVEDTSLSRHPGTGRPIPREIRASLLELLPTMATRIRFVERHVRRAVEEEGYQLHRRKKFSVRRRHHRQMVTGLVVNQRPNLPRETRRWLRAVEHRTRIAALPMFDSSHPQGFVSRKRPTLTPSQLAGWRAFRAMVAAQTATPPDSE